MISGQYRSFFIAWKSICNNSRKKDLNDIIFYDLRNVDKRGERNWGVGMIVRISQGLNPNILNFQVPNSYS